MHRTRPSHAGPLSALSLSLALAACAAAPPPSPPPVTAPSPDGAPSPAAVAPPPPAPTPAQPPKTPARVAKLQYEDGLSGAPAPLVDAVVGGQPTMLLVDTGATHHVIASWLARELTTATLRPAGSARDHGGVRIAVSRLEGVAVSISGYGPIDAPTLLVLDVPDDLRQRGIGGVISPQALARTGHAVLLDLQAATLAELPAADVAGRVDGRGPAAATVRPCAAKNGAGVLVAAVTIEGAESSLELDTGSATTSLSAATTLGKRLGKLRQGTSTHLSASGMHTVPTVPAAHVALGPFASQLDLDLIPRAPATGCGEGYAGMDLLRTCALLIDADGSRLWCAPRR